MLPAYKSSLPLHNNARYAHNGYFGVFPYDSVATATLFFGEGRAPTVEFLIWGFGRLLLLFHVLPVIYLGCIVRISSMFLIEYMKMSFLLRTESLSFLFLPVISDKRFLIVPCFFPTMINAMTSKKQDY